MKQYIYVLLITVLITGAAPQTSYAQANLPDYFICNYWYDADADGYLDDDEYVGIKDTFNTANDSLITFVGYYYNAKGKDIGLKLHKPDGTLYREFTSKAEYEPTHVHRWWYEVQTLANAASGRWTAKWYLDGVVQYTKTFNIVKPVVIDDYDLDDWLDWWGDYDDEDYDDFFACNKWVDKNNDDLLSRDEYVGIKDSFSVEKDTTVTFVSYWHNQKGKVIEIKIYNPQGEIWYNDTATVEFDPTYIYRWWFNVKKLASEGGVGNWTAKYYLDGSYHASTTVNISKLSASTKLNPQFFTCLGWNDKNNDSKIASDYSEFVGIKDTFNSKTDTDIYFYSHWVMKKGHMRKIKIIAPNGKQWAAESSLCKSNDTYWHPSYPISSMIAAHGKGNWKINWYMDDKQVHTKTITLK